MSRGVRYGGADRMARSPPRVPLRERDRGFSPPRRDRDRRYSPRSDRYAVTSRTRKQDYSPPRLHERDYLPPRAREHCYSAPRAQERHYSPTRARERQYSPPRARERQYSPPRARERQYSPPRARERQYSPPRARERQYSPPRARERRYTPPPPSSAQDQKHSPAPRLPVRNYLSPMRSQDREFVPNGNVNEADGLRGEYFHELERSRRMEKIYGGPDFGELKGVDCSSYGGVERWYGQSQSLRLYGSDGRNGGRHDGPPNSRRKYEFRDGPMVTHGDSTSLKYQFSNVDDPRKSDVLDDPVDHGFSGARVSSELGNEGRPYLGLADSRSVIDRRLRSSYEPPPSEIGVPARSSGFGDAGSYALGSHNFRMKLHRTEQNPLQGTLNLDELPMERQGLRDPYMETSTLNSLHHSKYDSSYMASSSHVNAFTNRSPTTVRNGIDSSFGENIHIPSDGIETSMGRLGEPMGCGQNSGIRSPKGQVDDNGIYLQSYFAHTEERHGSRMHSDIHGTKIVPSEFYRKNVGVSEEYNHQDASGASFMDPIKYDELSHQENMIGSKPWDYIPSKQGQATLGYFGASGALEKREQEMKILEYEGNNPDYERVLYKGHRSPCMLHNNEMDEHPCTFQERSDVLYRDNNPHLDEMNDSLQQRLIEKSQILPKSFTSRLKRKHGKDRKLSICGDLGITSSSNGRNADIYLEGDKDSVTISKKLKVNHSKYGKNRRTSSISTQHGRHRNLSTTMASRLSKTSKYGTRDIKKRLGPHPQDVDATHSSVKKHSSLKHRLGPPPRKSRSTLPWLKNLSSYKVSKDLNDLDESLPDQRDDHLESSVTQQKSEPLENLEDFKQLVDNAFFKFVKHLNETPARRTKYRNQGTSSCLKCIICGRDSEEFGDVESLVMHALTSSKAGVRSQHFGFHKALCVLMGWKSAEAPNSAWVRKVLPEDETLALKEDLIIWPPVVVIHNVTITNSNPDERVVVSVEELEAKLRDMGFGGKVCRGKPGNQSVLVVKFAATLSGLQEAERLGNLYAETKHGRAEFQQVCCDSTGSSVSHEQVPSADKMEEILYGYLGIVEDLDKLDFESKRRSKLKSKKEIQSISVAP